MKKNNQIGTENFRNGKVYVSPVVKCIKLDTEISLQLESDPPTGPDELSYHMHSDKIVYNPYKSI